MQRNRPLAALLLAGSLLLSGGAPSGSRPLDRAPSPAPARPGAQDSLVLGRWSGVVTQGELTYRLVMDVERLTPGGYAGTTTYSGAVACGGLLTFRRQRAGLFEFDETINTGPGCVNGRIEVYRTHDGRLEWEWYEPGQGGDPSARATLRRNR